MYTQNIVSYTLNQKITIVYIFIVSIVIYLFYLSRLYCWSYTSHCTKSFGEKKGIIIIIKLLKL